MLPGGRPVACSVTNLSEAGALVEFAGGAVPTRNFRLSIEAAPFTLLCEIRHQGPSSAGVKFLNPADGARMMAHLYPGPEITSDTGDAPRAVRGERPAPAVPTTRDLRQKVLTSLAERAAAEPTPAEPVRKRLPQTIWSSVAALARRTPATDTEMLRADVPAAADEYAAVAQPPAIPTAVSYAEDAAIPRPQPRRSRRNGIKGKSAGGIG